MSEFFYLIPISLALGLTGLVLFLWSLKNGQYEDLDGASERILYDDDKPSESHLEWKNGVVASPARDKIAKPMVFPDGGVEGDGKVHSIDAHAARRTISVIVRDKL
ncbi:cbb3-type cytochrome oxidase maturation protein [Phyllobacterium bourgognense]|uniref:Cbb3-type cytochrome oxidase maturation protein n=1 Tax=Phyllobacterium bourgognense TaxID=314236 RepID=A0A368YMB0_9HYPH|nr:cbb3-type cytochrome oxidase maturation protein [Phyllobacterium bourgognense]